MNSKENAQFCDHSALAKIRRQIGLASSRKRVAFLLLSGAFNPVHTQHVRALELARDYLERLGWAVVGGFLSPSSDTYVQAKTPGMAFLLDQRIRLCRLAIVDLDWASVCMSGEFSSNMARRRVQAELEHHCSDVLEGAPLSGVEVMSSDTVLRIFPKIFMENRPGESTSTQAGRLVCCLLRGGYQTFAEREQIETVITPAAAALGIQLMMVEPTPHLRLELVSSTAIREMILRREWEMLRARGWLPATVLEELERSD